MCWSAEADLVAGVVVSGLGVVCLARVRRPRDVLLGALPLVLGLHQLVEAVVWLGTEGRIGADTAQLARTTWAVVAMPLLAALVPVGVWLASGSAPPRRSALLAALGLATAAALTAALAAGPVTAEAHGHTLTYGVGIPLAPLLLAGYLLATLGSLLFAADRTLRLTGWLIGAAAVVSAVLWRTAFASTWCALAALAALMLLRWTGAPRGRFDHK